MAIKLSNKARSIQPSPTLAISSKAKQMKADGIDVINFGVGEPDFNTPDYIKKAAVKAIDEDFTRYTATPGIVPLRKAICEKLKRENNVDYTIDQILVSAGAKASIVHILLAVCDARDEVFVPTPYWVSYPSQINLADAKPVILPTDETTDFKITANQLEEAIKNSYNPKVLMLNSPNNPTGSVYTYDELKSIGEVCVKHNILIISDEIYEKLIYDGEKHISPCSISQEIKDHTVIINGVSKAYAMTGWRLGYSAGPTEIIKHAARIQGHTTSCVNTITQKAVVTALNEDDGSVEKMRVEFEKRRTLLVEELNKIENVSCNTPKGAFYALPNIKDYITYNKKGFKTVDEICLYLLENYHIAIVPGTAFGMDTYVRFSYANSVENIKAGVERFKKGLYSLLEK